MLKRAPFFCAAPSARRSLLIDTLTNSGFIALIRMRVNWGP
jgi:hypothetical protein